MFQSGTLINQRYEIVRQVGQGGMGAVYEAIDTRLGHHVALKQTLISDPQFTRAFEREARLLAHLEHPYLPSVTDHFSDADGQFLVMKFIAGDDLATLLHQQGGPFPPAQVLAWADQLLDALEYLHSQQTPVLHRDIKPQNLKLSARKTLVLLDFGLAKGALWQTHLTGGGSVAGYTPTYAPLEQIQGTGTDVRSDLYAAAATLYHLLVGTPPPDALTRTASLVRRQPDSLRPPYAQNPAIPAAVSAALVQAMELNPDDRPASATTLREALRATPRTTPPSPQSVAPTQVISPSVQPAATAPTVRVPQASVVGPTVRLPQAPPKLPALVPELVKVPAGPFLMGSSNRDKAASRDEKPQHQLTLPDYWIGKTPVTNAQFRPFVEGDGYTNRVYWTTTGWQWRKTEDPLVKPLYWDDAKWNRADHPVVGVSWFEAVAYCRWLSQQTGIAFRLPTEAEWEKSARGTDGQIYPWGNTWETGRCNSEEAHIECTTPVGQYPSSASPYSALDMVGNVWEWCATQWHKPYPYQLEDEWQTVYLEASDAYRVFRGGSSWNDSTYVRGAYRNGSLPRDRIGSGGLRVVSSSAK